MPLYETVCRERTCSEYGRVIEYYSHAQTDKDPPCQVCGQDRSRVISTFGIVFTGAFSAKYNDIKKENAWQEGHWAWRKKTKSGNPEPVWIDSFDAQRDFCKSEGLVNPKDVPTYAEVDSEGKKMSSAGMPGTWI